MKAIFRIFFACYVVIGAATAGAARQYDLSAIEMRVYQLIDAHGYSAALAEAQRLEAIAKARFGAGSLPYSAALFDLALVKEAQGKYPEAAELYQRSLAIKEKAFGPSHPDIAVTLNNLANVYHDQGKYAEAAGLSQRA